ncbi:hypothetical protein SEA_TYPHA_117 [Mycobacterium phage Typha]|uniref:Uncharacterized protein n=1 Tax=Mycobacterium phage Typha TaxID=2517971 RepID=A0A482JDT4_9CAUD|nr:hypothetical protein KCH40_gp052 [Mycobacterium phage Typha]QBP29772.1 hypothetical protein SEA_TYPHA_117 [Mycobacterium phage Typha]URM86558.1 hypothetical protein PBI_HILLTOPFARM_120 [Mycobacterium phage Hilltopfarm]
MTTATIDIATPTQELEWEAVGQTGLRAADPNGNGTWRIWMGTVSNYQLVFIDNDGTETKYGPRRWGGRQVGRDAEGNRIMEYGWFTLSHGCFREGLIAAREYAAKLVASTR